MNLFKGFIIGIGKIIPGVSGSILAIVMGVYDKSIYYIKNFNKDKKKSIMFLLPLGTGILLSIILFSKIINYLLINHYIMTMFFFVGLIIGTIPEITKETYKKDYLFTLISFFLFLTIMLFNTNSEYIMKENFFDSIIMFFSGILEAIGTIVPGVSSTALLMNIGTYKIVVFSISNIFNISMISYNLKIMIPFCFGIIIGMIALIDIIDYLFKKYYDKMYSIILGLLISTIIIMIINIFKHNVQVIQLFGGIILMFFGIFITNIFSK